MFKRAGPRCPFPLFNSLRPAHDFVLDRKPEWVNQHPYRLHDFLPGGDEGLAYANYLEIARCLIWRVLPVLPASYDPCSDSVDPRHVVCAHCGSVDGDAFYSGVPCFCELFHQSRRGDPTVAPSYIAIAFQYPRLWRMSAWWLYDPEAFTNTTERRACGGREEEALTQFVASVATFLYFIPLRAVMRRCFAALATCPHSATPQPAATSPRKPAPDPIDSDTIDCLLSFTASLLGAEWSPLVPTGTQPGGPATAFIGPDTDLSDAVTRHATDRAVTFSEIVAMARYVLGMYRDAVELRSKVPAGKVAQ